MEGFGGQLPFILLIFVVMYFFMIRPQMQKAKKEKKFAEELKKGDRVVTKSGLHGKVFDFSEKNNAVVIETGAGKLTFDKSAISLEMSQKLNAPPAEKKK
ncbi:protein translocase subunit yajC [Aquimarina amphilecti]|uniref:Sec translocon accessory complex subunit YajC n=1 Tax=Aquimarina amphilecti TaxID=1038014 RepID=A0A1H7PL45_AQUAM|nr:MULTISPECIES: preprotein translocase subunit YajC [Aquimarina]AXT58495.1 preprotein translocase subunit YajC [Aquimarina sp. AD1]MBQ4805658.1 preprotein translocase subunit YajC [Aquimarina sp. MMG015]RKN37580.1 preprotein translocase subunit YajC [Aquimarina sp. AD1]SEL36306.1 protein translocase subunit yajC [Aquimarina amphilecti]